jgi:hypothetical protein
VGPSAALGPGSWRKGAPAITGANRALLGYRDADCRNVITGMLLQGYRRDAKPAMDLGHESAPLGTGRPNGGWLRPAPDA